MGGKMIFILGRSCVTAQGGDKICLYWLSENYRLGVGKS